MMQFRDRNTRGHTNQGWLDTRHTFSFGAYRDPKHMGFRALRVINEDRVIPGAGFPAHAHADMEIITYVLSGALAHEDSLGTGSVIRAGEIQRMSAGSGITHSEYNASDIEPAHFLQIWIVPEQAGNAPGYEQKTLPEAAPGETRLDLIGSAEGGEHAVAINQDLRLNRALIAPGERIDLPLQPSRHAWLQVVRGLVEVEGGELREGDGLAVSYLAELDIYSSTGAELLIFDLA